VEVKQVLGGRYELQDQLGVGGMAVVWRAHDNVLGRSVAVKLLAGPHVDDPVSRRRIRDEARAAATLSHPNIAQVYDFGESDEGGVCTPYVVMELVRGGTLAEHMAGGPLPAQIVFRICAEVAAALAAAHADDLVHRDIKPANVMVTSTGAKVVDFGIAAAISSGGGESNGELFGTPAYLAPERLLGDTVEPASDVYALGVLLYKLLTGHSPWSADTTTKMLAAHVYVEPEPLPQLPRVPQYVTDLVNRCLIKDPTLRPSARDVASILAEAAGVRVVGDELAHSLAGPAIDGEPSAVLVPGPALSGPASAATGGPSARVPGPRRPTSAGSASGVAASGRPASVGPASGGSAPGEPVAERPAFGGPASARRAVPASPVSAAPVAAPRRRRRQVVVAAAALAAITVAGLVWLLVPGARPHQDRLPGAAQAVPGRGGPLGDSYAPTADVDPGDGGGPGATPGRPQLPIGGTTVLPDGSVVSRPVEPPGATQPGPGGPAEPDNGGGQGPDPVPTATRPPPTTAAPTRAPDPEPPAETRTLSATGGSVEASCTPGGSAELLSWTPSRPYKLKSVDPGPAQSTEVEFKHGKRVTRMTVTCSGGVPSADTVTQD
jgi:serine/threonine-protein kinase